jgi:hypothetical protein
MPSALNGYSCTEYPGGMLVLKVPFAFRDGPATRKLVDFTSSCPTVYFVVSKAISVHRGVRRSTALSAPGKCGILSNGDRLTQGFHKMQQSRIST